MLFLLTVTATLCISRPSCFRRMEEVDLQAAGEGDPSQVTVIKSLYCWPLINSWQNWDSFSMFIRIFFESGLCLVLFFLYFKYLVYLSLMMFVFFYYFFFKSSAFLSQVLIWTISECFLFWLLYESFMDFMVFFLWCMTCWTDMVTWIFSLNGYEICNRITYPWEQESGSVSSLHKSLIWESFKCHISWEIRYLLYIILLKWSFDIICEISRLMVCKELAWSWVSRRTSVNESQFLT